MIGPTIGVYIFSHNNFFTTFMWKSLACSYGCLVSSWSSLHLLCSHQRRCKCFWFFRLLLCIVILRYFKIFFHRSWLFCCFFFNFWWLSLLNWSLCFFFFNERFFYFWFAFSVWFGYWLKFFSYWLSVFNWRFFFLKLRSSLDEWRFSFSDRWFHGSFTLITFNNLL